MPVITNNPIHPAVAIMAIKKASNATAKGATIIAMPTCSLLMLAFSLTSFSHMSILVVLTFISGPDGN